LIVNLITSFGLGVATARACGVGAAVGSEVWRGSSLAGVVGTRNDIACRWPERVTALQEFFVPNFGSRLDLEKDCRRYRQPWFFKIELMVKVNLARVVEIKLSRQSQFTKILFEYDKLHF